MLFNCPKLLETPPQSPDLNPIENLWEHLDRHVRKNHRVRTKNDLKRVLMAEWDNITPDITNKLVMPKRLKAVITNKGNPTKY